jgi:hypothetical protein
MLYRLPSIPHLRLRFTLIAQKEAFLPSFKGSLLRGAFGHALRRTVCVMGPQQPCPTCMLRRQCSYPRIFETLIEAGEPVPRFLRGLPTAPRPYVIEPFDERRLYRNGDVLEFDFVLIGQAIELYPLRSSPFRKWPSMAWVPNRFRFGWKKSRGKPPRKNHPLRQNRKPKASGACCTTAPPSAFSKAQQHNRKRTT